MTIGRYIVAGPAICHGEPVFRGTRILVADVLEQVASGMAWEAILNRSSERSNGRAKSAKPEERSPNNGKNGNDIKENRQRRRCLSRTNQ